jgi:hypothetical protein
MKTETREQFIAWAERHGFTKDRYGNYVREKDGKVTRFKLKKLKLRYEAQFRYTDNNKPYWVRVRSNYWSNISINESNDKLRF